MSNQAENTASDPGKPLGYRTIALRWFGVLAPLAAAWMQQQVGYYLVAPACKGGHTFVLHLPPVMALLVTGLAAITARHELDLAGGWHSRDEAPQAGSPWLFGAVGLILSGLAVTVIVAQWLPTLFISSCQR